MRHEIAFISSGVAKVARDVRSIAQFTRKPPYRGEWACSRRGDAPTGCELSRLLGGCGGVCRDLAHHAAVLCPACWPDGALDWDCDDRPARALDPGDPAGLGHPGHRVRLGPPLVGEVQVVPAEAEDEGASDNRFITDCRTSATGNCAIGAPFIFARKSVSGAAGDAALRTTAKSWRGRQW
jgi:hypothetical protein